MITGFAALQREAAALQRQIRVMALEQESQERPTRTPVELARDLGIHLDPWQRDALLATEKNLLLLASRQAGKSTVASLLGLHQSVEMPGSLTLILSPGERQSKRLLKTLRKHYAGLRSVSPATSEGQLIIEFANGSEIHALPGNEGTVRGFSSVDLLIIDEAARVLDELYATVRPMLAVSGGRLLALSTPFGKRGFFHREYTEGGEGWHRALVTAFDIPRIPKDWLEKERARIGDWWFRQEFMCEFLDADDQLYSSDLVTAALSREVQPLLIPEFGG